MRHYGFQSTRPRGARHNPWCFTAGDYHVSIHAPAGGATILGRTAVYGEIVFQSTRPRGARPARHIYLTALPKRFNPRARGGRDVTLGDGIKDGTGFNPRARGGRDLSWPKPVLGAIGFNPRARGGRDKMITSQSAWCQCFNPRARGGRDGLHPSWPTHTSKFQSTRPRGARRQTQCAPLAGHQKFQSTRPRGARLTNEPDYYR